MAKAPIHLPNELGESLGAKSMGGMTIGNSVHWEVEK